LLWGCIQAVAFPEDLGLEDTDVRQVAVGTRVVYAVAHHELVRNLEA
jgi:hypothetical protein